MIHFSCPVQIIKRAMGSEEATTEFIVDKIEQASDRAMRKSNCGGSMQEHYAIKSTYIRHLPKLFHLLTDKNRIGWTEKEVEPRVPSIAGEADMEEQRDDDGNDEVAFTNDLKSTKVGHTLGINKLGNCYQNGIGIEKHKPKAFDNYQKPVDTAHIGATWDLKRCYQKDIDVMKDESKVITHRLDINRVGEINSYENGIGVEMDGHKTLNIHQRFAPDECEAFEWHLKNTKEVFGSTGKFETCCQIGKGTVKDERMAFKWDLKSAKCGKLPKSYESLETVCMVWKMKIESFKTQIVVTQCKNQKVKMLSCKMLNDCAKVNQECNLSNNDIQEMCSAWMESCTNQRSTNLKETCR
ncbi:hypothetical protein C2G38_2037253 [Gigaspora rosea]|uniref:Uncharacterized protein n=1 Tax=Gigaspora rosea TaxID=44941 RepID=A0A397V6F6_9GLOM|nr:hypothetical protein C2G38_2037253 [Gigaspora rosea]